MTEPRLYDRCATCSNVVSRKCKLCAGAPDPDMSLEMLAGAVAAVDRAVQRAHRRGRVAYAIPRSAQR